VSSSPPAPSSSPSPAPLHLVLVAGPKDHGLNEHDYPDWQKRWSRLLALADGVTIETANGWPSAAQLASADAIVIFSANPDWNAARAPELDAYLARGGGLVLMHYAVNGRDAVAELAQRIGLAWRDGASRFRHDALDLTITKANGDHPITRGFAPPSLHLYDESYWALEGDSKAIKVLATSLEDGEPRPQLWTREVGRGRVFVSLLGHFRWTFDDPIYRTLLLRAIAWSAHQPVDRLRELATVGARVDRR
jgi:type 1 glutamine amidotransferase